MALSKFSKSEITALVLSDSLLRHCLLDDFDPLKKIHDIEKVHFLACPGKTTHDLIGPGGEIHAHMASCQYDYVFLVSGANDFNRNKDSCYGLKAKSVAREI